MTRVAVTGMGVICATGRDCPSFLQSVLDGRCGISPIVNVDTGWLPTHIAGEVVEMDPIKIAAAPDLALSRADAFAVVAAQEAMKQAEVKVNSFDPTRIGVSIGTCQGNIAKFTSLATNGSRGSERLGTSADAVGAFFGARGPRAVITNACAAGASAIAVAIEMLIQNEVDLAIAGGTDELTFFTLAGFSVLQSLDPQPCAPYTRSAGLTVGEGAGIVVLERIEDAQQRGIRVLAEMLGYGLSADGYHPTAPDPMGKGAARAMSRALKSAGLSPNEIDYVNGHGTGTSANDQMERRALRAVFDSRADLIPMSSTKSMIGHLLGAAGAVEAITCILGIEQGMLPPTVNVPPGQQLAFDCVPGKARPAKVMSVLSNNYAFGGSNASLAIGRPRTLRSKERRDERQIVVTGVGCIGPAGRGADAWRSHLTGGQSVLEPLKIESDLPDAVQVWGAQASTPDQGHVAPASAWRKMDLLARLATVSSRLAWDEAQLQLSVHERDNVGVFLATSVGSFDLSVRFEQSARRGRNEANAKDFPHTSLNSAAGHICTVLGLHGPMLSISNGGVASITALNFAASLIRRGELDVALVVAAEELSASIVQLARLSSIPMSAEHPKPFNVDSDGAALGSGSVTVVLEAWDHAVARGGQPQAELLGTGTVTTSRSVPDVSVGTWLDAVNGALKRSGIAAKDLGYCAAAASGVGQTDGVEAEALANAISKNTWIGAPKSIVGDCLGAAGLVNVLAGVEAIRTGALVPTYGLEKPLFPGLLRHVSVPVADSKVNYSLVNAITPRSAVATAVFGPVT